MTISAPEQGTGPGGEQVPDPVSPKPASPDPVPIDPGSAHSHAAHPQVADPAATGSATPVSADRQALEAAGELLRALAAPVRIAIVLHLLEREQCVHELVGALGVTQPLISQHLRVLKAAGVVHGERHGREIMYRLVDDHLSHIVTDAVAHATERSE